jgi:hypothetical protein
VKTPHLSLGLLLAIDSVDGETRIDGLIKMMETRVQNGREDPVL